MGGRLLRWVAAAGLAVVVSACAAPPGSVPLGAGPPGSGPPGADPAPGAHQTGRADTPAPRRTTPSAETDRPSFAALLPSGTRQVVRTVSTDRWCPQVHCTVTQAWQRRPDGGWHLVREFRSSIAPRGWGKVRQDDLGTPEGVFRIKVTFSTTPRSPGAMPWRRRLPTSNVTDEPGRLYNTWIEEPRRRDGARPSMRWGFVVDYNHVRLRPGVGPAPLPGAGSGIFYHTSRPGRPWEPSVGCTRVGRPKDMRWLLTWLRPDHQPRVVQNR